MTPDEIRSIVRDELASLGGHLLRTYGTDEALKPGPAIHVNASLATLGGYMVRTYGDGKVAYRDPEPPAVGEPPTTTPGTDA